jgi:hypothetical protein
MIKINFIAQNTSWTEIMETYARNVLIKGVQRTALVDASFTIKVSIIDKKTKLIKVELSAAGFRAQCTDKDFYKAMSAVVAKFKSLVLKQAKKTIALKRRNVELLTDIEISDGVESLISKEKIFILDPCTIEDAIKSFEQTDYTFYVFKDIEYNNETTIIYKRVDDTLGIIRCK